ncbi:hypothetical protein CFC21_076149 [Triticum aestivum]|uniref:Uncharacterized protein n=2 Tax=Triticum aestivum TaxID=4565 RepID=A0A3B6MLR8_WHEAT|nr:hypothetical protein CFC21_076149 [Triticum aestivum]
MEAATRVRPSSCCRSRGAGPHEPDAGAGPPPGAHGLRPTFVSTRHVLSSTPPPGAPFRVAAISDGFDAGGFASCPDPAEYFSRLEAVGPETLRELLLSEEATSVRILMYDSHLPWAGRVARPAGVPAAAFFSQSCAVNDVYGEVWAGRWRCR